MAICTYCKKEFVPKKSSTGKYCSRECCFADFKKNGRPDPRSHKTAVCEFCGKTYQPKKWKTQTLHHYCSSECQHNALRRHGSEPVSCPVCGKQFMPTCDKIKYCSVKCSCASKRGQPLYDRRKYANNAERKRAEKARWKERHKDELEAKAAAKEAERIERNRRKLEIAYQKKLARVHECPVCGTTTDRPKYCCDVCAAKAANRRKEINRRHKLRENGAVDHSISLERLIRRDKNICHICGGKCDITDCQTVDGTFIAGNMYPSIDHVVAVANGGKHQWDNIKLAHMICNSTKNAAVLHEVAGGQLKLWV